MSDESLLELEPMAFRCDLTGQEVGDVPRLLLRSGIPRWVFWVVGIIGTARIFSYLEFSRARDPSSREVHWTIGLFALGLFLWFVLLFHLPVTQAWLTRASHRIHRLPYADASYTFSNDGIRDETSPRTTQASWNDVQFLLTARQGILFFVRPKLIIYLPNRMFRSDATRPSLLKLAERHGVKVRSIH
jgi:hypothetical protein